MLILTFWHIFLFCPHSGGVIVCMIFYQNIWHTHTRTNTDGTRFSTCRSLFHCCSTVCFFFFFSSTSTIKPALKHGCCMPCFQPKGIQQTRTRYTCFRLWWCVLRFFLSHSSFYYINIPSHPHPLTVIIRRLGGNTLRGCTKIGSITTLFKQMTPTLPWRTIAPRFRPRATEKRGMTRKKKKRFVLLPCLVVSCWCFVSLYCHSTIGVLNCEQPKKHLRERTRTKHTHTEARAYARLRNIGSPKGKPQNEHITADKHKNHVRQLAALNAFC